MKTFKLQRKQPISLLELLIAMMLLSLLLTALFGTYHYVETMHRRVQKEQKINLQLLCAQHRLAQVLPKALAPKANKSNDVFFFTKPHGNSPSLIFVFNNGSDGIQFTGRVLAKLFVDTEGKLTLVTWPSVAKNSNAYPEMHKEVLLENVSHLAFKFFSPPKRPDLNQKQVVETGKIDSWLTDWPMKIPNEEESSLPAIIKVLVELKKEQHEDSAKSLTFVFVLPHTKQRILFEE